MGSGVLVEQNEKKGEAIILLGICFTWLIWKRKDYILAEWHSHSNPSHSHFLFCVLECKYHFPILVEVLLLKESLFRNTLHSTIILNIIYRILCNLQIYFVMLQRGIIFSDKYFRGIDFIDLCSAFRCAGTRLP